MTFSNLATAPTKIWRGTPTKQFHPRSRVRSLSSGALEMKQDDVIEVWGGIPSQQEVEAHSKKVEAHSKKVEALKEKTVQILTKRLR